MKSEALSFTFSGLTVSTNAGLPLTSWMDYHKGDGEKLGGGSREEVCWEPAGVRSWVRSRQKGLPLPWKPPAPLGSEGWWEEAAASPLLAQEQRHNKTEDQI